MKTLPSVDLLIIGGGLSGLLTGLLCADNGISVHIVTKDALAVSNSAAAQGGIASVTDLIHDSFAKHTADTLQAGAFLSHPAVVEHFIKMGPDVIRTLESFGVTFSRADNGEFDLGREGGHSERRVIHAGDITGKELITTLTAAALAHPLITIQPHTTAIDLITTRKFMLAEKNRVAGAYILCQDGSVATVPAKAVLLSTGGAGKVYLYTSNPDVASGDGIAIGFRAGIPAVNMEMVQFHPTILYHEKYRAFLISEALRGEGGVLIRRDGTQFMDQYDSRGSLAPRDIVARAIDFEMKKTGDDFVLLDMTRLDPHFLVTRFPSIFNQCLQAGIDMRKEPIPVVPAAHYFCGGLATTPTGITCVDGVFCAGESAFTGFHGANRLASNSLLEASAMAIGASAEISAYLRKALPLPSDIPVWNEEGVTDSDEQVIVSQNWDEIRRFMWNYVGIVRSDRRLERALARINLLKHEIDEYYWNFRITRNLLELRNIALVAELVIRSAIKRKESRGLHYTTDYPDQLPEAKDTVILPEEVF